MADRRPLTPAEFRRITGVSDEALARLRDYVALLAHWQRRINLVSRRSLADVWRRHVLDSAQVHGLLPSAARTVVDLGSGAGFPGLVIAILGGPTVHLVESNARKCAFLRVAIRATGADARVHHGRVEDLEPWPADVVTARGLAPLPGLLDLAEGFLAADSQCLFLKGAGVKQELTDSLETWNMEVEPIRSLSDPSGTILRLKEIARRHA
jgi:16S rRNA (guanine527-N7)-methyltransferase